MIVLATVWLIASLAGVPQVPGVYGNAVAAYQSGRHGVALEMLSSVPEHEVRRAARVLTGSVRDERALDIIAAAAVLHIDWVVSAEDPRAEGTLRAHLEAGEHLARAVCDAAAVRCELLRQWYLIAGGHFQRRLEFIPARQYLGEAEARFRDDADILLARGSLHELIAKRGVVRLTYPGSPDRIQRVDAGAERRRAIEFLTRSLHARPDQAEARLRLGRIRYELHDLVGAERELDAVLRAQSPVDVRYLGLLFQAIVKEDLSRKGDALMLYAEAARLQPRGQAVFVGLAELYVRDGQPEEAAKASERLFATPERDEPWWGYVQGDGWHVESRLERLREKVRK